MDQALVFVISDSIGETAEQVARAATSQYNAGTSVRLERIPLVTTLSAVSDAMALVAERKQAGARCMIVYTLLRPELREALQREAARLDVPAVDVIGPTLEALQTLLQLPPRLEPGRVHRMDEAYFRRVEAIEFAVRHDDGKDPQGILQADVVLAGISRTSKTPLSMYLALRGYKVANVPLVPEVEPPPELFQVPGRVIGLVINPQRLIDVRQVRLRQIGLPDDAAYGSLERIKHELDFSWDVFRRLNCPVFDVTNNALEETAAAIMRTIRLR